MEWIKTSERLPQPENSFDSFLVIIEWEDTYLDKGEKKRFWDCAYYDSYHKLFVNKPDNTIIDDETTKVIYWAIPELPI